jgi:hypothetical protein
MDFPFPLKIKADLGDFYQQIQRTAQSAFSIRVSITPFKTL